MTVDEAIEILRRMDLETREAFSQRERDAISCLGMAGWSGDLLPDDPRLDCLPEATRETLRNIVGVMQTKRIAH